MSELLGTVCTTPDAAITAILDAARAEVMAGRSPDLVALLAVGPLDTRIVGEVPRADQWSDVVASYLQLAEGSPLWAAIAYEEERAIVLTIRRPDGSMTTWWATREGRAVGPWSSRRGDELDLAPTLVL